MAEKGIKLHGLLSTLLSDTLKPADKKNILTQEYGIATSVELEGGLSLVKDRVLSVEEAARRANLSVTEFERRLQANG
uniref:hypothetical protein n=1 Tax=Acetatifactor sp. TaxID=1872090 RepID=UPI004057CA10